jgi:N utilization substance protein B
MQSIYALLNSSDNNSFPEAKKLLNTNYEQTTQLAVANLLLAKSICEYSIINANTKSSKRLPTVADLNVSIKPSQNIFVTQMIENASFNKIVNEAKLAGRWSDNDVVKSFYKLLLETPEYKTYVSTETRSLDEDKNFFRFLLQMISTNEDTQSLFEDLFINFEEDKIITDEWVASHFGYIKDIQFDELVPKDKLEFGMELLETFLEKQQTTMELIEPKLINWEADRIAMMDLIILQMGITELLYFPNIPTKVTINEYIDLAKGYSTLQSGQFVNGVLDKIHKELIAENKIKKQDRPNKKA